MSVASNPYVPDGDLPWPEYDQPDEVTTMILYRKYRKALEDISKMDPDSDACRIAMGALYDHRTPEWLAGQKRIYDSERADRERSGHSNHINTMHKGGDT